MSLALESVSWSLVFSLVPCRQEFFNDLYHRFLLSPKPSMKAMCLQAMAIVYGNCFEEIGPFNDTAYIMTKMEEVRTVANLVI